MILKYLIIGYSILITAIIFNIIANYMSLTTWYMFFETVSEKGFKTLKLLDLIWLFLVYPLLLSLGYIIGEKIYLHFAT